MEIIKKILLAIIQGITEPLPISSSGHVVLFEDILGMHLPGFGFELFINFGSLLGIVVFFWKDLFGIVNTIHKKDTWSYLIKVPFAVIPAGIIGFFYADFFEQFKSSFYVGVFLLFTGVVLLIPKIFKGNRDDVTFTDSIQVGVAQVLALLPGISRSGMTTVAGMSKGLTKERAFSFSFLVFLPLSFASGVYSLFIIESLSWEYSIYFFVAAVMTYLGLILFKRVLMSDKLHYFSIYCFILGIIILV